MIHKHEYEQQIECNSCKTVGETFPIDDFRDMTSDWKSSNGIIVPVKVTVKGLEKKVWKHFCNGCRSTAWAKNYYPEDEGKSNVE